MIDDDQRLSTCSHDAVADVEPTDRLAEIRARTAPASRRRGWYAAGGAVARRRGRRDRHRRSSATRAAPSAADLDPALRPGVRPGHRRRRAACRVYFVGDTPTGTAALPGVPARSPGPRSARATSSAIHAARARPDDPDYRTLWPAGARSRRGRRLRDGVDRRDRRLGDVRDRPATTSTPEAALAVQQVVYTLQAAVGERAAGAVPLDGNPIDQVLGVPTTEPLADAPAARRAVPGQHQRPRRGQVVVGIVHRHGRGQLVRGHRAVGDPRRERRTSCARASPPPRAWTDQPLPVGDRGRRLRPRARAPTRSSR